VRRALGAVTMLVVSAMSCHPVHLLGTPALPHGILTQSYADMSGAQFDTLVNSVNWVDGNTRSRCVNVACSATVPVRIDANEASYTIDSLNPGSEGTLVARVRNMGSDTAYMYHFRPAPYRYYFLVKRSAGSTRWILLEHLAGSEPDSVATGPFTGCWDHPPATSAHADFRTCGPRRVALSKSSRAVTFASPVVASLVSAFSRSAMVEAAGWIGCAYGCCPLASAID
jgi:hypothetical protein